MVNARLTALADEKLVPRVGPEAARTLLRMSQFLPLFLVSSGVFVLTMIWIASMRTQPLWTVFVFWAVLLLYMEHPAARHHARGAHAQGGTAGLRVSGTAHAVPPRDDPVRRVIGPPAGLLLSVDWRSVDASFPALTRGSFGY
ncbi:hypothetical protein ACX801_07995 [Arthrobacter bambusae]